MTAFVPGGEHGLALGDPQRVRRDPGVKPQARIPDADFCGEELADGPEQFGAGRAVMGRSGRAGLIPEAPEIPDPLEVLEVLEVLEDPWVLEVEGIGHGQRRGVAQREQDVVFLLADAAAEHRELDRRLGVG